MLDSECLKTSDGERRIRPPELVLLVVNLPFSTLGGTEAPVGRPDVAPFCQGGPTNSPVIKLNLNVSGTKTKQNNKPEIYP